MIYASQYLCGEASLSQCPQWPSQANKQNGVSIGWSKHDGVAKAYDPQRDFLPIDFGFWYIQYFNGSDCNDNHPMKITPNSRTPNNKPLVGLVYHCNLPMISECLCSSKQISQLTLDFVQRLRWEYAKLIAGWHRTYGQWSMIWADMLGKCRLRWLWEPPTSGPNFRNYLVWKIYLLYAKDVFDFIVHADTKFHS